MKGTKATWGDAQGQLAQSQEMLSEMVLPVSPRPHCLSREQEIISRGECVGECLTRDKDIALKLQGKLRGLDSISLRGSIFSQPDIPLLWRVAGAVSHAHTWLFLSVEALWYLQRGVLNLNSLQKKEGQIQRGFNRYFLLYFHISSWTRRVSGALSFPEDVTIQFSCRVLRYTVQDRTVETQLPNLLPMCLLQS